MTWKIVLRKEAQHEFDKAYDWHEAQKEGLGDEFAECVQKALAILELNPKVHAKVYKEARRAVVERFHYCIYYVIQGDEVQVASIIHGKRHPRRWQKRI